MKKNYFITLIAMLFCCICANAQAELTFSNVSLEPGSKVEALTADQQITFNTNMDSEIGYMYAEVKDEATDEIVGTRTTVYDPNFNNDGKGDVTTSAPQSKKIPHFTYVNTTLTKLIEGHTYSIIFYAFTSKEASYGSGNVLASGAIQYEGATAAYVPSAITLTAISPDPNSHIITVYEESAITLTFSDKVRLDKDGTFVNTGQGTSAPYSKIEAGDDAEEIDGVTYSSSWTVMPSSGTIHDGTDVIYALNAYDKSGLHVTATAEGLEAYSTGNTEEGFYSFSVMNDYGRDAFTISPAADDASANSLFSFTVAHNEGISMGNIAEKAVLYKVGEDGSRELAATVSDAYVDEKIQPAASMYDDDKTLIGRIFLDKPVTAAGKYVLSFPRNYFIFGTGMMAKSSSKTEVEYNLSQDFIAPESKVLTSTTVKKLSKIEIQYPEFGEVFTNPDPAINPAGYIFNEANELVTKVSLEACWDYADANIIDCKLAEEITTPGTYKLVIPQDALAGSAGEEEEWSIRSAKGGVNMDDDYEDEDEQYTILGAFIQEFTVEAGSAEGITLTASIENNSTVQKPVESLTLTFTPATEGEEVIVACTGRDTDALWYGPSIYASKTACNGNVATVTPYTGGRTEVYGLNNNGEYTVTFPEGFFTVNGTDWPEITVKFILDIPAGIEGTEAAKAEAKSTFTISGAKISPAAAVKGVYIVNGKKVSVK